MARNIMVLFNSLTIREEAVQYSVELAKRMEAGLVFLMILALENAERASSDDDWSEMESKVESELLRYMNQARDRGIPVSAVVRMGDPPSELMKFLAGQQSFQTIVWGGESDLSENSGRRQKSHWLLQMKKDLGCPLVIPSVKSRGDRDDSLTQAGE